MSFALFCEKINGLCDRYGLIIWCLKHENGRHIARLSNGYTFIANASSSVLQIKNRNHSFPATFDQLCAAL